MTPDARQEDRSVVAAKIPPRFQGRRDGTGNRPHVGFRPCGPERLTLSDGVITMVDDATPRNVRDRE